MKAPVTGGAGFIGSKLARQLLADGHSVTGERAIRTSGPVPRRYLLPAVRMILTGPNRPEGRSGESAR